MVGVGRTVTGAVSSLSCPASQVPRRCYSVRNGGVVTKVSGWDPGHIYCGSGWLLMPSYGEQLGGGAVCPLCQGMASSEAEMSHLLDDRSATFERGGN